jgi:Bacterial Ig-like domain (group 3)
LTGGTAQGTVAGASAVGQFSYTAVYTGDGTFSGSRSNRLVLTITQAHSTTTVTGATAPKLGVSSIYTATVTPQFSGTPTGTVLFYADGEPIGTATLANGQASISYAATTLGSHKIEASYSGDANFITSLGVLTVKAGKGVSTVTLGASANPALYGSAVTLTATVTDSEGAIATGPVVFKEGSTIYGTVNLTNGSAQLTLSTLAIGTHKITVQYSGDTDDATATGTLSEVIQGLPTTTSVVTNTQPSFFGQNVTLTATISAASGTPDGTLTFKNGSAVLGTVTVVAGQATFTTATLAAGTHTITALYNGGTSFAASSGTVQQIVEKATTATALTSSLNPAATGTAVTFTATVSSTAAQVPTGNVTFKDGKTTLGTIALVNGQAQLTTALLAKGAHTITASYAASTNFAASNTTLTQTMQ